MPARGLAPPRRGGSLPTLDALWNAELPGRGHLVLVRPEGEVDWRYAICGTALAAEEGDHWRVDLASQVAEPDRSFVRRVFALTTERRDAVYAVHSAPNRRNVLLWERLMLPCRDAEGRIAIVMLLRPLEYVEDMIRAVLDSTPTAIIRARCVRDAGGRIVDAVCLLANGLAAGFLHRSTAELDQGCLLELFPSFWETGVFDSFVAVVETREPRHFEMQYRDGGDMAWFSVSAMPLGDGFTLSLADITARKQVSLQLERARNELIEANAHLERQAAALEAAIAAANAARADLEAEVECRKVLEEELRRLALTDALTGLANRPAIAAQGQGLAVAAQRRGGRSPPSRSTSTISSTSTTATATPPATRSWPACAADGGCLPARPASPAASAARNSSSSCRGRTVEAAAAFAEALRRRSPATPSHRATTIVVTASLGVAQFKAGEEFEDLLARCDEALYRAKRDGRDRVVRAIEPRRSRPSAAASALADRHQDLLAGAAGLGPAELALDRADGLRVLSPIAPSGSPTSKPRRVSRSCNSRRSARDRPGSSVGQGVTIGPPPLSRSDRWAMARA